MMSHELAFVAPAQPGAVPRSVLRGADANLPEEHVSNATPTPETSVVATSLKLVGLAALVGSVSKVSSRKKAVRRATAAVAPAKSEATPPPPPPFNPAEQPGAVPPLGFFDPLGFCKAGDERGFWKLRSAEIKHGRVAMMASVGAVVQHFVKLPGCENVKGTFGALATGEGVFGAVGIFVLSAILELAWRENENSRWPGDYGDPFGIKMFDEEMRNRELGNGRMAMISVLGIWAAELATGKDAIEQFGF